MTPKDKKAFIEKKLREFSQDSSIDREYCSKCKETCCNISGCGLLTCDVPDLSSVESIREFLNQGTASITFHRFIGEDGIELTPIMQSREIGAGKVDCSIIPRPCSLQNENGCIFSDEERPTVGILCAPNYKNSGECKLLLNFGEVYLDWLPYKKILEEVIFLETGKNSVELFTEEFLKVKSHIKDKLERKEPLTPGELIAKQYIDVHEKYI